MILTAQPFFNELDLLEIKFRELEGVVDAHVVVEATTTFTGLQKPLHFEANKERFRKWNVVHRVVELPAVANSPWEREAAQYAAVRAAVREINPEIAIWCDADEVPRQGTIRAYAVAAARGISTVCTLEMDQILFRFDRVDTTMKWRNAKIGRYDPHGEQPWRGTEGCTVITDAGWHFEYFGRRADLLDKLAAVSHAPEEGCRNMRRLVEAGELPGMERTAEYPVERLPQCVQRDPARWGFAPGHL